MSVARVAIVHASPSSIATMRRIVSAAPEYALVFEAFDAGQMLRRIASHGVDLVLLSLDIAGTDDGESITRLTEAGAKVLIVAGDHGREFAKVYAALERGAIDVVDLPSLDDEGHPKGVDAFRAKLLSVRRLLGASSARSAAAAPVVERPSARPASKLPLLAIGASTGGPNAIARVLADLPRPIDYAIVVVQHVDPAFSATVASWIARASGVPVEVAHAGQRPTRGVALLASTSDHLCMVANGTLRYTAEPVDNPYRPSVDVFFESVAAHFEENVVGVLLTGMGRDGARGMKALRDRGLTTLAQDEKTSVVWGMPRAAYEAGAVTEVLPIERIGAAAASAVLRRRP